MKYVRKRNSKKLKTLIFILVMLLIALIGAVLHIVTDRESAEEKISAETTFVRNDTESTAPEQVTVAQTTRNEDDGTDLVISTPYCDLYYPAEWKERIRTETESTAYGFVVNFYGTVENQEAALFTVFFAEASDESFPLGSIVHNGVSLDVNLEMSDFNADGTWSEDVQTELGAMQEGVNYLISKLEENPSFAAAGSQNKERESKGNETAGEHKANADNSDLVVPTEFCDLYFPAAWKQAVSAEIVQQDFGGSVIFYGTVNGKEEKLFTVFFAETSDESFPIGMLTVNEMCIDVSLALHEPAEIADWETLGADAFYTLQEQSNYLVAKLRTNEAFSALDE